MTEIVQTILSSQAGIYISIGLILYLIFAVKKGTISFHGKGLDIGKSKSEERIIIRDQWEAIKSNCEAMTTYLPNHLDPYRTKYIVAKVADIYEQAVVLNAISLSDAYLSLKYSMVYNVILKRTIDPYFKTEEFKTMLFDFNKKLLSELIEIRKQRES